MADSNPVVTVVYVIPPGTLFHPSEEQLICYYLGPKISNLPGYPFAVIKEKSLYNYEPFGLPENEGFSYGTEGRKKHWYYYVERVSDEERQWRPAGNGYWKKKDRVTDVVGTGAGGVNGIVVGTRKTFGFYLGNGNDVAARRTNWIMYEYALTGNPEASFVLCRVFVKSDNKNKTSDDETTRRPGKNVMLPPRPPTGVHHGTVTEVRRMEVMHDGPFIGEAFLKHKASANLDAILKFPFDQASEFEKLNITDPKPKQESFVLCKVLEKPGFAFVSYGKEIISVAEVQRIDVQQDGAVVAEAKLLDDNAADNGDGARKFPFGQSSALEEKSISGGPHAQKESFDDGAWAPMAIDGMSAEEMAAISENEDYIELNDLAFPLEGMD